MIKRRSFGDWGEAQACHFLRRHGFRVLERNYHTTFGEIDIVASRGGDYYFIEVKTRADAAFANDFAVTAAKMRKLIKTVRAYCFSRQVGADRSILLAGLIVLANRRAKTVNFRFCVFH